MRRCGIFLVFYSLNFSFFFLLSSAPIFRFFGGNIRLDSGLPCCYARRVLNRFIVFPFDDFCVHAIKLLWRQGNMHIAAVTSRHVSIVVLQ